MRTVIKEDGGQAFPKMGGLLTDYQKGMSLRDYFAAAALTGVSTNPSILTFAKERSDKSGEPSTVELAKVCWDMADAMIATRMLKPL